MSLRQRRRSQGGSPFLSAPVLGSLAGAVVLIVAVVWLFGRSGSDPEPVVPVAADATVDDAPSAEPDVALPELSRSDQFIRDALARLSSHPELAAWFVTEDLAYRFVASIAALAGRGSPASHLEFMAPEAEFVVRESGEQLLIDVESYRRYDLMAETIASLDTEGTARLYERLLPLFEEAHRELGFANVTFRETLELAVANVLAVQVPQGPIEVVPSEEGVVYEFTDTRLEQSSPAAKHLVRAGPENARRIQEKVEQIARAAGIAVD